MLVGATSDAIKSFGMESHVCRGLNINSDANHVPSERLVRINKNWSNISKSIRNQKYDYVLKYTNENGEAVNEDITKFSAGMILAVINFKDGTKREKNARQLEKKDLGKRKRDEKEEKEGEGSRKSTGTNGRKTNKRRKRNVPGTRKNYGAVVEDVSETLKSPKPFCMRMTLRHAHYSSDSSDSSDSDSEANAEESELQKEFFPEDMAKELEFLPEAAQIPAETKEDKLVHIHVAKSSTTGLVSASSILPYKSFLADSDSEAIAEESELQKEFFPEDTAKELEFLPEAAQTPAETEEDKLVHVHVPKSSTTGLVSASSILVKHSEQAKEMASQAEDSE